MTLLAHFLFRLVLGLAWAMANVATRAVTPGYFRNHAYVLLGMGVLLSLIGWSRPNDVYLWLTVSIAIASYAAAVLWLYEVRSAGRVALWLVGALACIGLLPTVRPAVAASTSDSLLFIDAGTSGLLMGSTLAAMLLGHWYLNAPGMAIQPIVDLTQRIGILAAVRVLVCGYSVWLAVHDAGHWLTTEQTCYLALRWLFGLFGLLGLVWMTLKILRIPNTQSATGVLYVAVLATFTGEITAMLLLTMTGYPM